MDYLKLLVGIKYVFYNEKENELPSRDIDNGPFWIGDKELPNIDEIKEQGMCCVGLINLLRRYLKLSIPSGINENIVIGGTDAWYHYLKTNNRLEPIDYNKKYKLGTLLIQNYNKVDQGHVAIVYDSSSELEIIHSQGAGLINKVLIEKITDSVNGHRYTHVCNDFIYQE